MSGNGPRVLLLGNNAADEFASVVKFVRTAVSSDQFRNAPDLRAVQELVTVHHWFPDLVVALQAWPGEFSSADVLELLTLAPLARIVCVCGVWCDSEGRTHANWPLAVRVPVDLAAARIEHELHCLRNDPAEASPAPISQLPLTASRSEIFAADFSHLAPAETLSIRVAVESPDRSFQRMLTAALRAAGHEIVPAESPAALVWDADPWDDSRRAALIERRTGLPEARLIAAVGFPRHDLAAALRAAGADALWFKLAPLAALTALLPAGDRCVRDLPIID